MRGKTYLGLLIGLAAVVLVIIASVITWPNYLELKLLDLRHRYFPVAGVDPQIVVIVIDDNSLEQVGQWTWPRRLLAHMVTLCRQAGARQVVLDILMPEKQDVEIFLPGVSDVDAYEAPAQLIGTIEPQTIDNDAIFAQAVQEAANITIPFHAFLEPDSAQSSSSREDNQLYNQVFMLLKDNPQLEFNEVFALIWPDRNNQILDSDYHQLLRLYRRCRSLIHLERFGFPRDRAAFALPVYSLLGFTPPIPQLAAVIGNTGFVSVAKDSDGAVRRIPLLGFYRDRLYKQLAFAAACRALAVNDDDIDLSQPGKIILGKTNIQIPLDEDGRMIISWTGHWREDRQDLGPQQGFISAAVLARIWEKQFAFQKNAARLRIIDNLNYQLGSIPADTASLDEDTKQKISEMRQQLTSLVDPNLLLQANNILAGEIEQAQAELHRLLAGKIVLVGSIATAVPDFVVTPFSKLTPGIVVHREILNTILQKSFIHRPPRWLEMAAILILGLIMTLITAAFRPLVSGMVVVVLVTMTVLTNFVLLFHYWHYFFAVVAPVGSILASFTLVTFYRQITEGRARRLVTARFKQYASPAVVDRIVRAPQNVSLAGQMRRISCYFSDLAGFTSISERLGPEKTVSVLNVYLDRMTSVLDRYYATINKFEGDGIFAFFGAPIELPDHCLLACRAALDAQSELDRLVQEKHSEGSDFPALRMRIGISTGEVVVGDCGSHRRFDYTAIGDTVNLGSRLEGASKAFGTSILICHTTFDQVRGHLATRYLGKVRVIGRAEPVGIYELLAHTDELPDDARRFNTLFEKAVLDFQQGRFPLALETFTVCLRDRPSDKAVQLYCRTLQELTAGPVPADFAGCLELKEK